MRFKPLPVVFLALSAGSAAAASDKPSYSLKDVTACSSDAVRLCRDAIPDVKAIQKCMKAKYDRLGSACRARFDRIK